MKKFNRKQKLNNFQKKIQTEQLIDGADAQKIVGGIFRKRKVDIIIIGVDVRMMG